jgi:formamidopyrimidine-DNA glycosylase
LPDLAAYLDSLERRVVGKRLVSLKIASPFLLRTAVPPISSVEGKAVIGLRRIGKRIVFAFEEQLFLVLHLMIAGRLQWPAKKGRNTSQSSISRTARCRSPRRERSAAPPASGAG